MNEEETFNKILDSYKEDLPFPMKIIAKIAIGLFTIFVVTGSLVLLTDLYYEYNWNWAEVFIVIIISIGLFLGAYLIGTLVWFSIPRILKLLRQRGDR